MTQSTKEISYKKTARLRQAAEEEEILNLATKMMGRKMRESEKIVDCRF
jgi:hypothetical protein